MPQQFKRPQTHRHPHPHAQTHAQTNTNTHRHPHTKKTLLPPPMSSFEHLSTADVHLRNGTSSTAHAKNRRISMSSSTRRWCKGNSTCSAWAHSWSGLARRARVCVLGVGVGALLVYPHNHKAQAPASRLFLCNNSWAVSFHSPANTGPPKHTCTCTRIHRRQSIPAPPPHYRLEHGNAKSADSTCTYGWMTLTATVCCLPLCVSCARYTCATHPEPTGSSSSSKNRSQPGPKAAVSVLCRQREHRHTQIQIQTQTHRHADTQARCDGGAGVDTTEHNRHTVSHVQARLLQACAASWPRLRVPLSR